MNITIDSGADVSIVPIECTEPEQRLGSRQTAYAVQGSLLEGEQCNVIFKVKDREFHREAIAVSGELINWTPCLSIQFRHHDDVDFFKEAADEREAGGQQLYQPLCIQDGKLKTGYMVSQGAGKTHTLTKHTPNVDVPQEKVVELEEENIDDTIGGLMNIEVEKDVRSNRIWDEEEPGDHGTRTWLRK